MRFVRKRSGRSTDDQGLGEVANPGIPFQGFGSSYSGRSMVGSSPAHFQESITCLIKACGATWPSVDQNQLFHASTVSRDRKLAWSVQGRASLLALGAQSRERVVQLTRKTIFGEY